jgi:hypothetical protein
MSNCIFCFLDDSASFDNSSTYKVSKKLELWVTSLSDTPCLQYYDVQSFFNNFCLNIIFERCL